MILINKNKIYVIVTIIVCVGGLFIWFLRASAPASDSFEVKTVQIGEAVIRAELALTSAEQMQGLSGRASLASSTGMLFVFDHSSNWGIWMKKMRFPIDVLWIADDMKIVDSVENMLPESYPKSYVPKMPARYVLELPAGMVKEYGMTIGQGVVF